MFAFTDSSYRAVTMDMQLLPGEARAQDIPAVLLAEISAGQMRAERSHRLRDTDWTQMADAPLTVAQKAAMGVYRQALRDLTDLPGFPNVSWPALPSLDGAAGDGSVPI